MHDLILPRHGGTPGRTSSPEVADELARLALVDSTSSPPLFNGLATSPRLPNSIIPTSPQSNSRPTPRSPASSQQPSIFIPKRPRKQAARSPDVRDGWPDLNSMNEIQLRQMKETSLGILRSDNPEYSQFQRLQNFVLLEEINGRLAEKNEHEMQELRNLLGQSHIDSTSPYTFNAFDSSPTFRSLHTSRNVRDRIAAKSSALLQAHNGPSISLDESIRLQQLCAQRERQEAEERALRREKRMRNVGSQLQEALKQNPRLADFMFPHDSEDEEESDDYESDEEAGAMDVTEDYIINEEDELNPYHTAYRMGYEQAIEEEV